MNEDIRKKIEEQCRNICDNSNGSWIDMTVEAAEFGYNLASELWREAFGELLNAPHQEHFVVRFNEDEMKAFEKLKQLYGS